MNNMKPNAMFVYFFFSLNRTDKSKKSLFEYKIKGYEFFFLTTSHDKIKA
jgi:hypothetical protein